MRVPIDEDLPRSLALALDVSGVEAHHVLDVGLCGAKDNEVFAHAVSHDLILLTGDLGFGNILRFPLGQHPGIVVAHFPNEISTSTLNGEIARALSSLSESELR